MRVFFVPEDKNAFYKEVLPPEIYEKDPLLIGAAETVPLGEKACGILALTDRANAWEIEWIYVDKAFRGRGAGRAMVELAKEAARVALSDGLFVTYVRNKKENLDLFFERCGLQVNAESKLLSVIYADISGRGIPEEQIQAPAEIRPLSGVTRREYYRLQERILTDAADRAEKTAMETEEESPEVYLDLMDQSAYHPALSQIYFDKEGEPSGCILLSKRAENVVVEYLYVKDAIASAAKIKIAIAMLRNILGRADDEIELGNGIYVNAVNPGTEKLFQMVAGKTVKECGTAVERVCRAG